VCVKESKYLDTLKRLVWLFLDKRKNEAMAMKTGL